MDTNHTSETINRILKDFEPIFQKHSGGAELVAVESDAVVLRILGHCNNCALAPLTFGLGIEQQILRKLPHIKQVKYTS